MRRSYYRRNQLYDQVSKLSGRFSLLSNAEYNQNLFWKLLEAFRSFRDFGTFQNFVAFRNAGTRTTSLRTTTIKKHQYRILYSEWVRNQCLWSKIFRIFGNLGTCLEISENFGRLPKLPKFRQKRQICQFLFWKKKMLEQYQFDNSTDMLVNIMSDVK